MNRWEEGVEHQLRTVLGDGNVSDLPGAGKPLDLADEQLTPPHLRAAHKIMRDNDVMPDWMVSGRQLERLEDELRREIDARTARHRREMTAAALDNRTQSRDGIELAWTRFLEDYRKRVERYNREALLHNLKAPQGVAHRRILNCDLLIMRALQL